MSQCLIDRCTCDRSTVEGPNCPEASILWGLFEALVPGEGLSSSATSLPLSLAPVGAVEGGDERRERSLPQVVGLQGRRVNRA